MAMVVDLNATQHRLSLAAVLATAFGVGLTLGMTTPLVSLRLEAMGHSELTIGLVAAAYSMALLAAGPMVPGLIRRFGPIRVILAAAVPTITALLIMPALPVLLVWLLARVVMGLGNTCEWIVSETWVNSLARDGRRGRVIALYSTIWGAGTAGGPVILWLTGIDGFLPFVVAATLMVASVVPVWLARRLAPVMAKGATRGALAATVRRAPRAIAAAFLSGFSEGAFFALFPVYLLAGGFDESMAVLVVGVFAAGAVLMQPPTGWLADRIDRNLLLGMLSALALACTLAVPWQLEGSAAVFPILFLWGGAVAGYYTIGLVKLGHTYAGSGDLAHANTSFIMTYTVGMMLGPVLGGLAMELAAPDGLIAVLAVAAFGGLFLAVAGRTGRRPAGRGESRTLERKAGTD